jgi:NADH-quinone oxidoreductase subunit L
VGVYSVAMFHLLTHAFFKAMLFLGAGSVIHGMHHEQDMRNYGGLRKKLPLTFWAMLIGTFAITGVGIPLTTIGFAGFLSKDAIIESAYAGGTPFAFWALVVAAAFTSFYSWRLMFLTFWGEPRGDHHTHDHAHESPAVMTVPLGVLAVGSILAGMVWYGPFFGDHDQVNRFFGIPAHAEAAADAGHGEAAPASDHATMTEAPAATDHAATTEAAPAMDHGTDVVAAHHDAPIGAIYIAADNHVIDDAHHAPKWVKVSPFVAMLLGFLMAFQMYIRRPDWPAKLATNQRPLYLFLLNKWYFDEIYDFVFVRPAKALGRLLWKKGDGSVIDGTINWVAMGLVPYLTRLAGRAQSGYVFTYAFAMVLGLALILTWVTISGGAN